MGQLIYYSLNWQEADSILMSSVVMQFEIPRFRVQPLGCCFEVQLKLELLNSKLYDYR